MASDDDFAGDHAGRQEGARVEHHRRWLKTKQANRTGAAYLTALLAAPVPSPPPQRWWTRVGCPTGAATVTRHQCRDLLFLGLTSPPRSSGAGRRISVRRVRRRGVKAATSAPGPIWLSVCGR